MTTLKIILAVLQFINGMIDRLRDQGLIDEGYDKAIAQMNEQMLRKSNYVKKIRASLDPLDSTGVDDLLQQLEHEATKPKRNT